MGVGRRQAPAQSLRPGAPRKSAETAELLRRTRLFSDLPSRQLKAFVRYASSHEVEAGTELLTEDEPGRFMGVVIAGACSVSVAGQEVGVLGAGECFGEMSLIDGQACSATVTSSAPTEVLLLGRSDFDHVLKVAPGLSRTLMAQLCRRLREVSTNPAD